MEGPSLIPSALLSLSSSFNSCTSTNRLSSSSSSSSIIPLSSLSPTYPPLLSSRFHWDPITRPRPLEGLATGLVRWEGLPLWIRHMQTRGNLPWVLFKIKMLNPDLIHTYKRFCLHSRNPLLASDGISSPANPPDMSGWNPFGEDNFSKLTEEELIDREFDMLRASKCPLRGSSVM